MKKFILNTIILIGCINSNAQDWLISGNSNLASSSFLGSTNNKAVVFKTNNIESGRIEPNATWRFGNNSNNVKIDSNGKLTFSGNGAFSVGNNKYIFRYSGDAVKGFYLNSAQDQYQFLNANGTPIFYVNGDNGNSGVLGSLKVGAYTLPSSDGNKNQVLKTDGAGNLIWKADNGTAYTAGTGINISGDTINSTTAATQWTTNGNKIYYNSGNVGIGITSPVYKLDVKGDINQSSGSSLKVGGEPVISVRALNSNIAGNYIVAIGDSALFSNNSLAFYSNTAVGSKVLYANTTGYLNIAIGDEASYSNTTGSYNTASGGLSLYYNTTGEGNTANGNQALYSNKTGNYNTAVGFQAMNNNISGNHNSSFGYSATSLGDYSSSFGSNSSANAFNSTALGANAYINADNTVWIADQNVISIGGEVNWTSPSDGRIKKNIKQNVPGLLFINKLQPVTYNLNLDAADKITQRPQIKDKDGKVIQPLQSQVDARKVKQQIVYTGFIAQDVEKAAKSLNYDFSGVDAAKNNHDLYGLRYAEFVVPLVKAVQELSAKNDSLQNQNIVQQKQIDAQQKINADLQDQINQVKAMITSSNQSAASQTINLSSSSLDQNIPNPFNNTTTIHYILPEKFLSAEIMITNNSGKTLRRINISGAGKGSVNVDASTLSSGAYQYTLIVNGKTISTKQMILAK